VMGISLRTKATLPFALPPLIWKHILELPPDEADLEGMDKTAFDILSQVRKAEGVTNESFSEYFDDLAFAVMGSDGIRVPLVPGGDYVPVDYHARLHYCRLAQTYRLHTEFDVAARAMRRGLQTIIPERVLGLFTWSEFEVLICGSPEIDVELLKRHTTYQGYRATDRTIRHFWAVLESFTNEERALFVRFAWGRSRLPRGRWSHSLTLTRVNVGEDRLPLAHTCFFQIELPPYRTEARMREKLLVATTYGQGAMLNW